MQLMLPLRTAFVEVMKFGDMATDVAKVFATMDIEKVEYLLNHPEKLRSKLQSVAKDLKQESGLPDLAHLPLRFEEMPPQNFYDKLPPTEPEEQGDKTPLPLFHDDTPSQIFEDGWPHDCSLMEL